MIEITLHSTPDDNGDVLSFDVIRTSSCGRKLAAFGPYNSVFIMDDEAVKGLPVADKKQLAIELAILGHTYGIFHQ